MQNCGRCYFQTYNLDEGLHQDSKDSCVRIVNSATLRNLFVKSTNLPHRNISKYTWTSPVGKTDNQIDHILIVRIWHSNILYVRPFMRAGSDTSHYLVVATVRENWQ